MTFLHSIFLTGSAHDEDKPAIPERIAHNIESFKMSHPDSQHQLYDDHSLRDFISRHFGNEVVKAFDALGPFSYKADLGRFCLLYERGGVYADVSVHFFFRAELSPGKMYVFRDGVNHAPWILSTSLIYAPSRKAVFESCIKKIISHVKNDFYGYNPLCPTGPNLWGREMALCTPLDEFVSGEAVRINRDGVTHSYAYIGHSGELIAVNAKRGCGLTSLGAQKDDNYNDAWHARNIYAKPVKFPASLFASRRR